MRRKSTKTIIKGGGMKRSLTRLLVACSALIGSSFAYAYPEKPVTIVVAWGAGGATDILTRALQPAWSKNLGAELIIKNVTGAAGTIGTAEVAAAKADGYTIIVTPAGPMTTQPHMRKLPYSVDSFAPIGRVSINPQVMMVAKESPYKSAKDLFDAIKKSPGKILAGSTGAGTLPHIGIIAMNQSGLDVKHLPFQGSVNVMKALLGNSVQVFSDQSQLVPSFEVRPIATWSGSRLPEYPDVPTMKELGFDYDIYNWVGAYAPANTPPHVLTKLSDSLEKTVKDPAVMEALKKLKVQVSHMDPYVFQRFTKSESARNRKLLEAANLLAK
jgi:tripartite-type tricarboxylate transporter receptor subunit TctC